MVSTSGPSRFLRASRRRARQSADPGWREPTAEALKITHAGPGEHEFLTARSRDPAGVLFARTCHQWAVLGARPRHRVLATPPAGAAVAPRPLRRRASRCCGRSRSLQTVSCRRTGWAPLARVSASQVSRSSSVASRVWPLCCCSECHEGGLPRWHAPAVPDKTAGASWMRKRAMLRYNSIVYAIDIRTGRLRARSKSTTDLTVCACGPVPLPAGHTGVLH